MKDLLGLKDLSAGQIGQILDEAAKMKELLLLSDAKKRDTLIKDHGGLRGKNIHSLFYENSTRTKVSFEQAGKAMGSIYINVSMESSSVKKGETLIDTGKTLDALGVDTIIIRHGVSGAPHLLARTVKASVINAGDGMNEHPTQALLDIFTVLEQKKSLKGLKVAIIGDVKHSRVARSNIWGMTKLGMDITVAAPHTLLPQGIERTKARIVTDTDEAMKGADVVMSLRMQLERMKKGLIPSLDEFHKLYGINQERMNLAAKDAMLLHPGPMNRGVEIAYDIPDADNSFVERQVTNGLAVRMAVMKMLKNE